VNFTFARPRMPFVLINLLGSTVSATCSTGSAGRTTGRPTLTSLLAGLRWRDVDLEPGVLHVRSTGVVVDYKVVESSPKTEKGRRAVGLDPATVAALRAHRVRQTEEMLGYGKARSDDGLVFVHEDGSPYHPQRFTTLLAERAKAAGVPLVKLHALRHGHATAAPEAGIPMKIVSERLGHSRDTESTPTGVAPPEPFGIRPEHPLVELVAAHDEQCGIGKRRESETRQLAVSHGSPVPKRTASHRVGTPAASGLHLPEHDPAPLLLARSPDAHEPGVEVDVLPRQPEGLAPTKTKRQQQNPARERPADMFFQLLICWSGCRDLNPGPLDPQTIALPDVY